MNAEFKIAGKIIETERLLLRAFELSDLDDFYEYASIEGVGEMAGWHHHKNKEESLEILKMFIEHDKTFAIVFKKNNKVIGSLGIEKYSCEDTLSEFFNYQGRELGYVLSKDYWGKGIMPEALMSIINYLFQEKELDFLTCGYYESNQQSKRVQEKCGFKPYRKLTFDTKMETKQSGILNLLLNPEKDIHLVFSHPESLIYEQQ